MQQSPPPTKTSGRVYLVGAGPGDPGLFTLRGRDLLGRAQTVVYDYLANPRLLEHAPRDAEFIYAGKRGGVCHTHTQEEINRLLVDRALAGKTVVRLKGGDPFIFGRGGEEIEALVAHGIPFEVVPGVTSAAAAATYSGIPITHRNFTSSVVFVTGHEMPGKPETSIAWDKLATGAGTIVIYMGIKNLPTITRELIRHGRSPDTPAAVVRWASTPSQRSVVATLATIAAEVQKAGIKPPAIIIVGEVIKLRDSLNWFEKRPLFGKRVLVTRSREQASDLVRLLEEQGAFCIECPTIQIEPVDDSPLLHDAMKALGTFDWLVFTSPNAVAFFFAALARAGLDARSLAAAKVAVVGAATADLLQSHGIRADLMPRVFTGDGLADALLEKGVRGSRILLPRAEKARESLPERLVAGGADLVLLPLYRNVCPVQHTKALQEALTTGIDCATFSSSSTVTHFLALLRAAGFGDPATVLAKTRLAAIGPVTAATLRENGLPVHIMPATHTIPALVAAIADNFNRDGCILRRDDTLDAGAAEDA